MTTTSVAYHHATIIKKLPAWSRQLPPAHLSDTLSAARQAYLNENGEPYTWFAGAQDDRQAALRQAIARRDLSRNVLAKVLGLQGISAFCEPLLRQALAIPQPVTQAQYCFQPWDWALYTDVVVEDILPGVDRELPQPTAVPHGDPQRRSLLAAALHNFESLDAPGPLSTLHISATDPTPLPHLDMHRFVRTCRTLDLGKRYQEHLESVYDGARKEQVRALSMQASRDELTVQTEIARMRGEISDKSYETLDQLCQGDASPTYGGHPACCRQLQIFGMPIHEVLLISPNVPDAINPCIVYTPGDPFHPIREYASLQDYGRYLKDNLLRSDFRRLISSYVPRRLQPEFSRRLTDALFETRDHAGGQVLAPRAKPHISFNDTPLPDDPWAHLYRLHVRRVKDDARQVAVPTADADAAACRERLQHWLDLGLDVVNVAALFIPALNPLMLALGAFDILGKVFKGFEAWEEGDMAQALVHVESLALTALSTAVLVGVGAAIKASGFVDALVSVVVDDEERLWQPSLKGYESRVSLPGQLQPNQLGQYTLQGRQYVRLDGELYEQFQDPDGRWRIRHPDDPQAYCPRLEHDGQGAWRLEHEQPLTWSDSTLLRRLGHATDGLDDGDLLAAKRITATGRGVLERAHLMHEPPPALLGDALARLRCDTAVDEIVAAVRTGRPLVAHKNFALSALTRLPGWPQDHVLQVFEGAEPWGPSTTYGRPRQLGDTVMTLTRSELEQGELAHSVLGQMDEATKGALVGVEVPAEQRVNTLQALLADDLQAQRDAILHSLYTDHQPPLSDAAAHLGRVFSSLPREVLEEIVSHASSAERARMTAENARIPLRIAEEARRLQARLRLDRAIMGLYRPSLANSDTLRLIEGLQAEQPGLAAEDLLEAAISDRARAARQIGQQPARTGFRSPLRLSDGRIGYPLSGRPRLPWLRDEVDNRIRHLYPTLSSEERRAFVSQLRQNGDIGTQITALEQERFVLDGTLMGWTGEVEGEERTAREAFSQAIRSAWRQEGGQTLELQYFTLATLPPLPARFAHITTLNISNIGVQRISPQFLACFPSLETLRLVQNPEVHGDSLFLALRSLVGLRELNLSGNGLNGLPIQAHEALRGMTGLRSLILRRNLLRLTPADLEIIAGLPLERLDLRFNAITLDPVMAGRFQGMIHLRELDLSLNPLHVAPDLRFMARLENLQLNDCGLAAWPQGLTTLMSQRNYQLRHVDLSNNGISQVLDLSQVLATPYAQGVHTHRQNVRWHFNYNPLEADTALRLRETGVAVEQEPAFQIDEAGLAVEPVQVDWLANASEEQRQLWAALFEDSANRALQDVLERVGRSAQAQHNSAGLSRQIWRMVQRASEDQTLRERLVEVAGDFPASCGDAGTDAFSTLEIEMMAYDESDSLDLPGPYLFNFYRRLFLRSQVNELASRIHAFRLERQRALFAREALPVEARGPLSALPPLDPLDDIADADLLIGGVDDIEIRLALRQALAEPLGYPEPSQDMLYRQTAQVSLSTEYNVEQAVLARDLDASARRRWILQQDSWQRYLRRHHAQRFADLTAPWHAGLDYLAWCVDDTNDAVAVLDDAVVDALTRSIGEIARDAQGRLQRRELNSEQYTNAANALSRGRQQAEETLLRRLTAQQDPNP